MDQIISQLVQYLSQPTNVITLVSGIFVCAFIVASMQTKNIKYTMLFQLLCNGFGMVSYLVGDDFRASEFFSLQPHSLYFSSFCPCFRK